MWSQAYSSDESIRAITTTPEEQAEWAALGAQQQPVQVTLTAAQWALLIAVIRGGIGSATRLQGLAALAHNDVYDQIKSQLRHPQAPVSTADGSPKKEKP